MKACALTVLNVILTCYLSAEAKEVRLFERAFGMFSRQVRDYNPRSLLPGDTVIFSNNERFVVGKILGEGHTATVFELPDYPDKVLRLPKHRGRVIVYAVSQMGKRFTDFIDYFVGGAQLLGQIGVPVVQIYQHRQGEYAVVQKLIPKSLNEVIREVWADDPALRWTNPLYLALLDFARQTANLSYVGDLHEDNIVYDYVSNKFIMMDFVNDVQFYAGQVESSTIFDKLNLPILVLFEVMTAITMERARLLQRSWSAEMIPGHILPNKATVANTLAHVNSFNGLSVCNEFFE